VRYTKPPLSFTEQLNLLEIRGLQIADREGALKALSHLNYSRLRFYWNALELSQEAFISGATFEGILELYVFDRNLRSLLMDAIEQVEVSIRSHWAHGLSLRHGAHAYLNRDLFSDQGLYRRSLEILGKEVDRSQEACITHYRTTYENPVLPPIWAVCEVMSFGQLSKWISNLARSRDRQDIADSYDLDEQTLKSFLHHLTSIRNLCAHHCRIWNRHITIAMRIPTGRPQWAIASFNPAADRRIYNTLVMLGTFLAKIAPGSAWTWNIRDLLDGTAPVDPATLGFPAGWRADPFWNPWTAAIDPDRHAGN
jgi:abortive infection bacteriophage resistance protein